MKQYSLANIILEEYIKIQLREANDPCKQLEEKRKELSTTKIAHKKRALEDQIKTLQQQCDESKKSPSSDNTSTKSDDNKSKSSKSYKQQYIDKGKKLKPGDNGNLNTSELSNKTPLAGGQYLDKNAMQSLYCIYLIWQKQNPNLPVTITSAYRDYDKEMSLVDWDKVEKSKGKKWETPPQGGKVYPSAPPGTSKHGLGLAVDIRVDTNENSFYNYLKNNGASYGWTWFGSQDDVHFTYDKNKDKASSADCTGTSKPPESKNWWERSYSEWWVQNPGVTAGAHIAVGLAAYLFFKNRTLGGQIRYTTQSARSGGTAIGKLPKATRHLTKGELTSFFKTIMGEVPEKDAIRNLILEATENPNWVRMQLNLMKREVLKAVGAGPKQNQGTWKDDEIGQELVQTGPGLDPIGYFTYLANLINSGRAPAGLKTSMAGLNTELSIRGEYYKLFDKMYKDRLINEKQLAELKKKITSKETELIKNTSRRVTKEALALYQEGKITLDEMMLFLPPSMQTDLEFLDTLKLVQDGKNVEAIIQSLDDLSIAELEKFGESGQHGRDVLARTKEIERQTKAGLKPKSYIFNEAEVEVLFNDAIAAKPPKGITDNSKWPYGKSDEIKNNETISRIIKNWMKGEPNAKPRRYPEKWQTDFPKSKDEWKKEYKEFFPNSPTYSESKLEAEIAESWYRTRTGQTPVKKK